MWPPSSTAPRLGRWMTCLRVGGDRAKRDDRSKRDHATRSALQMIERKWTFDELKSVVDRSEALVGLPLAGLIQSFKLGERSSTPPKHRHRLIELLLRLKAAAASPDQALLEDVAAVNGAELDTYLAVFDEWKHDPAWPEFQRATQSPSEFLHAYATLAVAGDLKARHSGVKLVASATPGRSSDLMVVVDDEHRLAVEVKTSRALWQRHHDLDLAEGLKIVRAAVKSAGTGFRGQLRAGEPGVLVIAGMHLADDTFDTLTRAIETHLNDHRRRGSHLLGVVLFNLFFEVRPEPQRGQVSVYVGHKSRLRRNPRYNGKLALIGDWGMGWTLTPR